MTERLILELKTKFKNEFKIEKGENKDKSLTNNENNKILLDLELTLKTLNYTKKEINSILPNIIKEIKKKDMTALNEKNISFEHLLKFAMNYLDNDSSNIAI